MRWAGRARWIASLAVAAYNIGTAENPRITSYNVCYTKLLRGWSKRQFREVVAQLDRCGERAAQKGDRVAASSLTAVRITSYNVCYTKLLRAP